MALRRTARKATGDVRVTKASGGRVWSPFPVASMRSAHYAVSEIRRPMVLLDKPLLVAISRTELPAARRASTVVRCTGVTLELRPMCWPARLAAACPARTRSIMSECSNSATAPKIWKVIFPAAVRVSILSSIDMNSTPHFWNLSRASSKCCSDRANLSNFQTTTMSILPRWQSSISLSSAGRLFFLPEIALSTYSLTVQSECRWHNVRRPSRWSATFWCPVETLMYKATRLGFIMRPFYHGQTGKQADPHAQYLKTEQIKIWTCPRTFSMWDTQNRKIRYGKQTTYGHQNRQTSGTVTRALESSRTLWGMSGGGLSPSLQTFRLSAMQLKLVTSRAWYNLSKCAKLPVSI